MSDPCRELYLNLMKRVLTGMVYDTPPAPQWWIGNG
jgi:hypothetical protein